MVRFCLFVQMKMKRWFANIGAMSAGLVASLLLAEAALRIAGVRYPSFYTVDRERGFALRPGAEGVWSREGRGSVRINQAGFRGADLPEAPTSGLLRIAVLGDSFTEALQVDEKDTFVQRLQINLTADRTCALRRNFSGAVEVLNFGVGAYGTGQELLTWRHLAKRYRPDLVILAIYPGNDFTDNEPIPREDRPVFFLDPKDQLQIDQRFRDATAFRWRLSLPGRLIDGLMNHSRLLQLLNEAKNRLASRSSSSASVPPVASMASDQAWQLTDRLIGTLASEVLEDGALFAVISTSAPEQVWPNAQERLAKPFAQEQRLAALLAKRSIPYLPLGPALQRQADRNRLVLHGFQGQAPGHGHWNPTGHRLAAAAVTPWVCGL